jgi:hypothetical protein
MRYLYVNCQEPDLSCVVGPAPESDLLEWAAFLEKLDHHMPTTYTTHDTNPNTEVPLFSLEEDKAQTLSTI